MSYLDDEEPFEDKPEEMEGKYNENTGEWQGGEAPRVAPAIAPGSAPQAQEQRPRRRALPPPVQEEVEEFEEDAENEDFSAILNDANLRLEQGQLYKLIMNAELFNVGDADEKAIKNVQREIRKFAKERMEVMLGMRQEAQAQVNAFPMESFPFNSLEVEVLKSLAATATKGASEVAAPFTGVSAKRAPTINTISGSRAPASAPRQAPKAPGKPLQRQPEAPMRRTKLEAARERILAEEGVSQEEWDAFHDTKKPLSRSDLARMSEEEIIERNKQVKATKQVSSPHAVPMPSQEHMEAIYTQRAAAAATNPQMQMIMSALEKQQKK